MTPFLGRLALLTAVRRHVAAARRRGDCIVRRVRHDEHVDRWRRLLDYARWAPSPHNIQPWRLQPLSQTEAKLLYVPDRLLPDTDPSSAFTISGLGIFVEHLAIAARAEGLDLDVELLATTLDAEADGAQSFARLHLAERPVEEPLPREL